MANVYEGFVSGKGLKFGIVVARFNEFITSKLLGGALDTLHRHETNDDDIDVAWVPGAFELPIVAKKMAESKGIAQVGMQTGVPTIFSVVTTENIEQAIERAGTKAGNKGADGAMSAMEMANLLKKLG